MTTDEKSTMTMVMELAAAMPGKKATCNLFVGGCNDGRVFKGVAAEDTEKTVWMVVALVLATRKQVTEVVTLWVRERLKKAGIGSGGYVFYWLLLRR